MSQVHICVGAVALRVISLSILGQYDVLAKDIKSYFFFFPSELLDTGVVKDICIELILNETLTESQSRWLVS